MNRQVILLLLAGLLLGPISFSGQSPAAAGDSSLLDVPPGRDVAIVAFECLACRDCALADPRLQNASAKYHVPLIRHDFPLRFHPWSYDAAILARWFDGQEHGGGSLGPRFRDAALASQAKIVTKDDLRDFATHFALPTFRCQTISTPREHSKQRSQRI
jgi:hypothetical protein